MVLLLWLLCRGADGEERTPASDAQWLPVIDSAEAIKALWLYRVTDDHVWVHDWKVGPRAHSRPNPELRWHGQHLTRALRAALEPRAGRRNRLVTTACSSL